MTATPEEIARDARALQEMLAPITYVWNGAQIKLTLEYVTAIANAGFVLDMLDSYQLDGVWPLGLSPRAIGGSAGFHWAGQIDAMRFTLTIQVLEGEHYGTWTIRIKAANEREALHDDRPVALAEAPSVSALVLAAMGR